MTIKELIINLKLIAMASVAFFKNRRFNIEDLTIDEIHQIEIALIYQANHFPFKTTREDRAFNESMVLKIHDAEYAYAHSENQLV